MKFRAHDRRRAFTYAVSACVVVLLVVAYALFSHPAPTPRSITVAIAPLPVLLPHAHGTSDKVSDPLHGITVFSAPVTIEETIFVTDMKIEVRNAPQNIIHHLHLERVAPEFATLPSRGSFLTVGQDTTDSFHFPAPIGIRLAAGTEIQLETMLHNPVPPLGEGGVYKDVVVSVVLSGVPEGGDRFLPLYFDFLKLTDPPKAGEDPTTFIVPPHAGRYVRTAAENPSDLWASRVFGRDGWIIHMGAHLHPWEGGRAVDVYLNGEPVKSYRSHRTDPDIPWSWRTNVGPWYARVHAGDEITFTATYENDGDEPIEGAMGMLGFFFVPDPAFTLQLRTYEWVWQAKSALYPLLESVGIRPTS